MLLIAITCKRSVPMKIILTYTPSSRYSSEPPRVSGVLPAEPVASSPTEHLRAQGHNTSQGPPPPSGMSTPFSEPRSRPLPPQDSAPLLPHRLPLRSSFPPSSLRVPSLPLPCPILAALPNPYPRHRAGWQPSSGRGRVPVRPCGTSTKRGLAHRSRSGDAGRGG